MSAKGAKQEAARQLALVSAGTAEIYGEADLEAKLVEAIAADRPLRVKLGMDPSAPDLHLGHCVVLEKLRRFQELGHTPIFLVGDFTARIGDPSGKKKTRPALSAEQVRENAATYVAQVGRVLDADRAEIRFNSEWMDALAPADWVRLCSHYTVARLLERDDFDKRYKAGEPISVHEFLYPFVQAYDSVALEADVELGGTDQTFNLLMAREVQRAYRQKPQAVLTHPLLVGTDGVEKMSKSLGNTVGITDPPEDAYGKIMSIPDALMRDWIRLLTEYDFVGRAASLDTELERGPMAAKQELAAAVISRFHDEAAAEAAAQHFQRVVQRGEVPDDVPEFAFTPTGGQGVPLLEILESAGLVKTRSEARRLAAQGAVQVDGERVEDVTQSLPGGSYLIRAGRRRYARARIEA
ncbi:MAG: tyrosine--tRNA ligase [Proteobacteria bacterium]|nr:tyrosine--tRNA ligase [Pseudomonadota bacterium]